jgi:hypothetical protein
MIALLVMVVILAAVLLSDFGHQQNQGPEAKASRHDVKASYLWNFASLGDRELMLSLIDTPDRPTYEDLLARRYDELPALVCVEIDRNLQQIHECGGGEWHSEMRRMARRRQRRVG